jgi:hypothetical protein
VPGREMLRLHKCHHAFCLGCLGDYAKVNIDTGRVEWLLCPDGQCQLALLPVEIKAIVDTPQLYEKYERLLLQKTLEQMPDIVWCPRWAHVLRRDGSLRTCIVSDASSLFSRATKTTISPFATSAVTLRVKSARKRTTLRACAAENSNWPSSSESERN